MRRIYKLYLSLILVIIFSFACMAAIVISNHRGGWLNIYSCLLFILGLPLLTWICIKFIGENEK